MIYQARIQTEFFLKEVLYIHLTPEDQCFNRDTGTDLPGCWTPLTDSITESKNEEFDDDYSHSMLHFVHAQLNTWDGLNNIVLVHISSQL